MSARAARASGCSTCSAAAAAAAFADDDEDEEAEAEAEEEAAEAEGATRAFLATDAITSGTTGRGEELGALTPQREAPPSL